LGALEVIPAFHRPTKATVPVAETFFSIQGEGKLAGVPSQFIRLSGCNLRCRWCDTPYASWEPEVSGQTIDGLVELARSRREIRHAVLTGGEPMMFQRLTELSRRLAAAVDEGGAGMHITIETAGTIIPSGGVTCDLMSISPKLSNSTPTGDPRDPSGAWAERHESRRINIPVLRRLLEESRAPGKDRQLKFVVAESTREQDLLEIDELLANLGPWEPADVLLMPEGVTVPRPAFARWLAGKCLERGWRYCPRLHIELWGNQRGR
jgi:7-carboxy-7-deazaguanine synthase